jgi:hypothetical protein
LWKRAVLKLVATLVAADLLFLGFGALSIQRGNPFLLYYPFPFTRMSARQLSLEANGSATGWPSTRSVRPQANAQSTTCGAALGGSFTFSDDVADSEAWPAVLSTLLGCNVDNLGIDGFGLDQTIVDYRGAKRADRFVIVGIAPIMLIADGAASWTFYSPGPDHLPDVKPSKPFFRIGLDGRLILVPRPPPEPWAIEAHHAEDLFRTMWTPLLPPFSYNIARAIYKRRYEVRVADLNLSEGSEAAPRLRRLAWNILRSAQEDQRNAQAFVILMIPTPEYALADATDYGWYIGEMRQALPGTCIIDPYPRLHAALAGRPVSDVRTSSGHFSAEGNAALASAVAAGLRDCGILH